jgi:ribonuclease P protein component
LEKGDLFENEVKLGQSANQQFPKTLRVSKAHQYRMIYEKGRRKNGQYLQLIYVVNEMAMNRFGISIGRRYGGAVLRNWLKRRIREAIRRKRGILQGHWDIVFCPKPKTKCPGYAELEQDVSRLFKQLSS